MKKKEISLTLWKDEKVIVIVGIDFLHSNYVKRLVIEKIIEYTPPIAKHKYTNNNAIYSFCERILDYAKKDFVQVALDNKIKKIISNLKDQEKKQTNNIEIAKIIKFLSNLDSQNIFNLNLLKKKTKQKIPSDYDYYFKLFDNIADSIKKNMNLGCKPYLLQQKSIYHHIILGSACNFSVPGAGKTLISLIIFLFLKSENKVNKLLLIAPLSSYVSWKDEYLKFIKNASVQDVLDIRELSYKEDRLHSLSNPSKTIYLINYEKIYQNENLLIEFLKENDVFLVFDEAHKVKNFDSKRTQAAKKIAKHCKNKLILTGTPMPKGYEDLATYFEVINPSNFKNTKILNKNEHELKQMTKEPSLFLKEIKSLQKQIDNFYIRISKKNLNLGKQNLFIWSGFKNDEVHQKLYEIIEQKLINELKISRDKERLTDILKARIFRLMQVSIDPRMVFAKFKDNFLFYAQDQEYNDNDDEWILEEKRINKILQDNLEIKKENSVLIYETRPTRYNFCFQEVNALFKNKQIKKIIIWSCWIYVIEELFKVFSEKGYVTEKIYGITEFTDREKYFHDFQDDKGEIQVLICNPASVSESISLHQSCHDAVYFDMTWNALYYMQSRERIHRYNKKENPEVNYYILIHNNSIDNKIWNNINKKEKKMLEIIENKKLLPLDDSVSHLIWDDVLNDYKKEIKLQQK